MTGTHDCGSDAAAYVLGALEPDELKAFQEHLEQCAVCRDEVEAFGGVVQALPMAAPQLPPPRRLRRRLMRAIREEPKAKGTRRRRRSLAWSSPRVVVAAVVAAAVVTLAVVAGIELSSGAGGRVIQARVAGVAGTVQLREAGGRWELIARRLSPPPPGHIYEVWLKAGRSAPTPASVLFSVGASGSADVGLPGALRGVSQVLVTPEPDGGSPVPTHNPVIVARLG
jgi:anti-sigma-K factor RskA